MIFSPDSNRLALGIMVSIQLWNIAAITSAAGLGPEHSSKAVFPKESPEGGLFYSANAATECLAWSQPMGSIIFARKMAMSPGG